MNELTIDELLKLQSERNSRERGFIDFDFDRGIAHVNIALTEEEIFGPFSVLVTRGEEDEKYQGPGPRLECYKYDPNTDSFAGMTHEESCSLACQPHGISQQLALINMKSCCDANKPWEGLAQCNQEVKIYWEKKMGDYKRTNMLTRERFKPAERQAPPLPLGIYDYPIVNDVPQIPKSVVDYIFFWI